MAGEPLTLNTVPKRIAPDPQDFIDDPQLLANWIYDVSLEIEKSVQTELTASNGVILVGTDIQHEDTSEIADQDTSGAQVVDTMAFDTFGHVVSFSTRDLTTSDIGAEPSFDKNDAFNKNFGTDAGTVLEGDTTLADLGGQPLDDTLTTIAATDPTTDQIIFYTGTNVASVTSLTAFARTLLDDTTQGAMQTTLDVDPAGTDNSTNVTLAGALDYLTLSGQEITLNAIDLTADVSGDLPVADGGTGASAAADARTNLDVDQAGTDNSTDVTLDGTPDYITIVGQVITRALINLTSHVTGILPLANGGTGDAGVTSANIGHLKSTDQDIATTDAVDFLSAEIDRGISSPRLIFTNLDTTPDVTTSRSWLANNNAATTITTFNGGLTGQVFYLVANNANTTLQHSTTTSGIRLKSGANETMGKFEGKSFIKNGNNWWIEV